MKSQTLLICTLRIACAWSSLCNKLLINVLARGMDLTKLNRHATCHIFDARDQKFNYNRTWISGILKRDPTFEQLVCLCKRFICPLYLHFTPLGFSPYFKHKWLFRQQGLLGWQPYVTQLRSCVTFHSFIWALPLICIGCSLL